MSQSTLTCGNEAQSVLKILIIIDLVISILGWLVVLLAGIGIFADPRSKDTTDFIAAEFDTKKEGQIKGIGWYLIAAAILLLSLNIFLFYLIYTGIKKRNYAKCGIWFIIFVVLLILRVIGLAYWGFPKKTIIVTMVVIFFWILLHVFHFYLLDVAHLYFKDLKREVFGGAQNGPPENNQVV